MYRAVYLLLLRTVASCRYKIVNRCQSRPELGLVVPVGPERRTSAMAEEGGEGKAATRKNKREADQDADARAVSGNGVERAEGGEVGEGVTEEGRPKIRSTRKVQRHLAAERIR